MLFWKRNRVPSMARARNMVAGAALLAVAKGMSVWILAGASQDAGGDWWQAAAIATAALAPSAALEAAALWQGFRFARRFLAGPSLDDEVRDRANRLAVLLYCCFIASALGLLGAGYALNLGIAVAAPVLAPLAPLAIAAGALKLLSGAVAKGAAFEEETRGLI